MVDNQDYSPYRVMASQEFAPGVCFVTGTATGPFIDTGVYIPKERFGQLVLSKDFIADAAHRLGLFAEVEDKIERAYEIGYAEGVKEETSVGLDRAIDQLGFAVDVLRNLRDGSVADVQVAAAQEIAERAALLAGDGESDSAESIAADAIRAAVEGDGPAGDEGPDRVPAGAGDGDPFRV